MVVTVFMTYATKRAAEGHPIEEAPERWAAARGLSAKYTLERAAWQEADVTTTVSELVDEEANLYLGRPPDVITPNGWDVPATLFSPRGWKSFFWKNLRRTGGSQKMPLCGGFCTAADPSSPNKGTLDLFGGGSRYKTASRTPGSRHSSPCSPTSKTPTSTPSIASGHYELKIPSTISTRSFRRLAPAPGEGVYLAYLPVYLEGQDGVANVAYQHLLSAVDTDGSSFSL